MNKKLIRIRRIETIANNLQIYKIDLNCGSKALMATVVVGDGDGGGGGGDKT